MGSIGKLLATILLSLFLLVPTTLQGQTLELGFTPSHVYDLWNRINKALLTYGELVSKDQQWIQQLRQQKITPVEGKIPADVLIRAKTFEQLLNNEFLNDDPVARLLSDTMLSQLKELGNNVKPSEVFLFSNQQLFRVVKLLVKHSAEEVAISFYLTPTKQSNKTPSDVYAQIVLAEQRFEAIVAQMQRTTGENPQ